MKKIDLVDLFMKIGGLYALLYFVSTSLLPSVYLILGDVSFTSFLYCLMYVGVIYLILYFFILKTSIIISPMKIDGDLVLLEKLTVTKDGLLSFGIIILGVFFVVNAIANIIIASIEVLIAFFTDGKAYFSYQAVVFLILGFILILFHEKIVRIVNNIASE